MSNQINHMGTDALSALIGLIKGGLNEKVDKADGKGLSANDFTTEEKTKLAGLSNTTVVDDLTSTDAASALSANQGKVLDGKIAAINEALAGKGSGDMAKAAYDTDGDGVVDDAAKLGGQAPSYYAAADSVPEKVSQLANDSGFQTADDVSGTVNAATAGLFRYGGSHAYADLPAPSAENLGVVYHLISSTTVDNRFIDYGAVPYSEGLHQLPAGTDVVVIHQNGGYRTTTSSPGTARILIGKDGVLICLDNVYCIKYDESDGNFYRATYRGGHMPSDPELAKPLDTADPEIAELIKKATIQEGYYYDALGSSYDLSRFETTEALEARGYQTADDVAAAIEAKGYLTGQDVQGKIDTAISSVYKPCGSTAFAGLPAADEAHLGMVYNVTDAFTTTDAFLEGAGKSYPAGTNVGVVADGDGYKYDALAGFVDTSGLVAKGDVTEMTEADITSLWNSVTV